MNNGAATAAGFYVGIVDDASKQLASLEKRYRSLVARVLQGNEKLNKSLKETVKIVKGGAALAATGSASAGGTRGGNADRRMFNEFRLVMEPEMKTGFFRRLFGSRMSLRQQAFHGKLTPLAKGGIAKSPTAALIGEGGQDEAVIPLERGKNTLITLMTEAIYKAMPKGLGSLPGDDLRASAQAQGIFVSTEDTANMIRFFMEGKKHNRDAAADAQALAKLFADQMKDRFRTEKQLARFQATLAKQLVPTINTGRQHAQAMSKSLNSLNGGLKKGVATIAAIQALAAVERGVEALERVAEFEGVYEGNLMFSRFSGNSLANSQAMIRDALSRNFGEQVAREGGIFKAITAGNMRNAENFVEARQALFNVGVRDFSSEDGREMLARTTEMFTATGLEASETAQSLYFLKSGLRMSVKDASNALAGFAVVSRKHNISTDELNNNMQALFPGIQALGLSVADSNNLINQSSALTAASLSQFADAEFSKSIMDSLTDPIKRISLKARFGQGMSMEAFTANAPEQIIKKLDPIFAALGSAKTDADRAVALSMLRGVGGSIFEGATDTQLMQIGKSFSQFRKDFADGMAEMASDKNQDKINQNFGDQVGLMQTLRNVLSNIVTITGVGSVIDKLQAFDAFKITSGILGSLYLLEKIAPSADKASKGVSIFTRLFGGRGGGGGAGAAGGTTIASAGQIATKSGGNILRFMSGFITVGGKFFAMIGGGLVSVLGGLGRGLGALLIGLSAGLTALGSNPAVWIGTLVFAAIAGGLWILAKAAAATAPAITALFSGIGTVVSMTLSQFALLDWKQMIAAGPAMTLLGAGFASMATGILIGVSMLNAADTGTKLTGWLTGQRGGVFDRLRDFISLAVPLASAMSALDSSPSFGRARVAIPVPVFNADTKETRRKISEVVEIYEMLLPVVQIAERLANMPKELAIPTVAAKDLETMGALIGADKADDMIGLLREIRDALRNGRRASLGLEGVTSSGIT